MNKSISLLALWKKLAAVSVYRTTLTDQQGVVCVGGFVQVEQWGENRLVWQEQGAWENGPQAGTTTRNRWFWQIDRQTNQLSLGHLRYGPEQPVHLADFVFGADAIYKAVSPHYCPPDSYHVSLDVRQEKCLLLSWQVSGQHKAYNLQTEYSIL